MANGNQGIGSFLPFPTFGGEKSGGITPVQLSPMSPNFPTPRAINRRTPEPEFKETIAPLLPFATEGLLGLLRGEDAPPTTEDRQEYIKEDILYGEERDPTTPFTKLQQAKLDAYDVYGEPDEGGTDWGSIIANLAVGSQMGRGAGDYATTALALNKAGKTKGAATETARASFVQERLKRKAKIINLIDTSAAARDVLDERKGYVFEDDPEKVYVHTEDGYTIAGPQWAIRGNLGEGSSADILKAHQDPQYKQLIDIQEEISEKELALMKTQDVAIDLAFSLEKAIDNKGMAGTTYVAEIASFVNDLATNYDQLTASFEVRYEKPFLEGKQAKAIHATLAAGVFDDQGNWTGNQDDLIKVMNDFVDDSDPLLGIRDKLGQVSYNNVSQVAQFLQIAYQSAATAGQTGRTLSDKDLAFFLQMTGYGATQAPQVQLDNLLRFVDSNIKGLEIQVKQQLSKNGMARFIREKVPEGGNKFTWVTDMYWTPKDGNYLDFPNYQFKDYYERNKGIGQIDQWKYFQGKYYDSGAGGGPAPTGTTNTSEQDAAAAEKIRKTLGIN
jgi:hypothetical protein